MKNETQKDEQTRKRKEFQKRHEDACKKSASYINEGRRKAVKVPALIPLHFSAFD